MTTQAGHFWRAWSSSSLLSSRPSWSPTLIALAPFVRGCARQKGRERASPHPSPQTPDFEGGRCGGTRVCAGQRASPRKFRKFPVRPLRRRLLCRDSAKTRRSNFRLKNTGSVESGWAGASSSRRRGEHRSLAACPVPVQVPRVARPASRSSRGACPHADPRSVRCLAAGLAGEMKVQRGSAARKVRTAHRARSVISRELGAGSPRSVLIWVSCTTSP